MESWPLLWKWASKSKIFYFWPLLGKIQSTRIERLQEPPHTWTENGSLITVIYKQMVQNIFSRFLTADQQEVRNNAAVEFVGITQSSFGGLPPCGEREREREVQGILAPLLSNCLVSRQSFLQRTSVPLLWGHCMLRNWRHTDDPRWAYMP